MNKTTRAGDRLSTRNLTVSLLPLACAVLVLVHLAAAEPPDRLAEAIEAQREALASNPNDSALLSDLGNLLALDGRLDEAEAAYDRALELSPEHPEVLYNLALLQQSNGHTQKALDLFKRAAVQNPNSAWTHFQIGSLLREKGRRQEAVEAYTKAFSLDPTLAFSDTNPQMIGNDEATTALLRVEASVKRTAAPRTYFNGERIRDLLVTPNSPASDSESESAQDVDEPEVESSGTTSNAQTVDSSTEVTGAHQTAEALTAEAYDDQEDEEVGTREVGPDTLLEDDSFEDERDRGDSSARTVRSVGRQDLGGTVNQSLDGGPAEQPVGGTRGQMNRGRGRPSNNSVNTPTTRFRPGRRSSARLERVIVPGALGQPDERAPQAAAAGD